MLKKILDHGRQKVHYYFLLLLCKSSIWGLQSNTFSKVSYISFDTSKCAANHVISFHLRFIMVSQVDFEAMKAGKMNFWPWDHSFKTSACLGGEWFPHVRMVQRSQYIRIKNPLHKHFAVMPMVGGYLVVKNRENLPTS